MIIAVMPAAPSPGAAAPAVERFPVSAVLLATVLFGSALFGVNNLILEAARAGWQQIQLIQGTFEPAADAQKLYAVASSARAVDSAGSNLPDVSADGKIRGYDGRIMEQAARERRLRPPAIFKAPSPS